MSHDEYFATGEPLERQVFDAVHAHLASVGPLIVEFLSVGIFFKRARTFCELRPKRDRRKRLRVELCFMLSRPLSSARFARTWHGTGLRAAYFVDLSDPGQVDEEVHDWLTEAYEHSPT